MNEMPTPALLLSYPAAQSNPFLKLVRTLGILAVILGSSRLALFPVWLRAYATGPNVATLKDSLFLQCDFAIVLCMSLILATAEIIVGIYCIRLRSSARRLTLRWAYTTLGYSVFGFSVHLVWTVIFYARQPRVRSIDIVWAMFNGFEQWLHGIPFAVLVIVLMRFPQMKYALEGDQEALTHSHS